MSVSSLRARPSLKSVSVVAAGALALGLLSAAPAMAAEDGVSLSDEAIELLDTTEQIGPGITLRSLTSVTPSGWYDQQILSVDLADPAVSSDLLAGEHVTDRNAISAKADAAGAVAGVNGDFFDIDNSGAPLGAEVRDGELLKSSDYGSWAHVGVGDDGIGRYVDATLDATATFGGVAHPVVSLNASNSIARTPRDAIIAYTPRWGDYPRSIGVRGATDVASVLVQDDIVVSVDPASAGAGEIPPGAFVLVGREAGAAAIRALQPGAEVTLGYELRDEIARQMTFVIGSNRELVRDGVARPDSELDNAEHPRTVIGFKDGGRTMLLVTNDGRQAPVDGMTMRELARFMVRLGAETAWNLDGGGSTTMVARSLGDDSVTLRNNPSDGSERLDPNGVGVFVAPGSGLAQSLVLTPGADEARVFPGLHRTLTAKGVDDHLTPVAVDSADIRWTSSAGSIDGGLLAAPSDKRGRIAVKAATDTANGSSTVRVLAPLHSLELSTSRVSIAEAKPANAVEVGVLGRDADGYTAEIEPVDLDLEYDRTVIEVTQSGTRLKITPLANGGTVMVLRAGDQSITLPITVGVQIVEPYGFDDDYAYGGRWTRNGTAGVPMTISDDPDGIRLDFGAARNKGITAASSPSRWVEIPGQPLRVRIKIKSDVYVPSGLTYAGFWDSAGKSIGVYGTGLQPSDEWQYATFEIPQTATFPIRFNSFQGINTSASQQVPGRFVFGAIEADVPSQVDLPGLEPLRSDPLVSADGTAAEGVDWTFATMSDVQFTASSPDLTKTAIAALHRIRAEKPDLVVLNGDITDRGLPEDVALARATLEAGGCQLIAVGEEPEAESTPDHTAGTIPCYYVPGNHESYGAGNVQATLDPWEAEFGQPYRTFDHKGTRFILLNSALGTLRGSDWDQLPMLEEALATAADDPAVSNAVVFAHHPVEDPAEVPTSQLGDGMEVRLIEKLLADFRAASDKGAAMIGSHAQIVDVHREEGVPYFVHPTTGKAPYGTPDRGGFTGWVEWEVDRDGDAGDQWLTADVRAYAQEVVIEAPDAVEVGTKTVIGGHIVQPSGVSAGSRIVPLAYPMSVHWSGDKRLAIGSGDAAMRSAQRSGKVAILDPVTRQLTALRPGAVTLRVTNDSLREYTGEESLAPVSGELTVQVVAAGSGAAGEAPAPTRRSAPIPRGGEDGEAPGQDGPVERPVRPFEHARGIESGDAEVSGPTSPR